MTSTVVEAVCRMPIMFRAQAGVSMVALFQQSGYSVIRPAISESDIERYLRSHPEVVSSWVAYSEDQRCSPSWYLAAPGVGLDTKQGWRVGYYASEGRLPERLFPDEYAACAFFITRYLEELSKATR